MQKFIKLFMIFCLISVVMICTSCGTMFQDNASNTEEDEVYGLEISNTKGVNAQGVLIVTGDVKNISEQNVKKLIITVTFYNDANEELTKNQIVSEDILLPNDSYHFEVNCLKKEASQYNVDVKGY